MPAKSTELDYLVQLSKQSEDSTLVLEQLQFFLAQQSLFSLIEQDQTIGFLVQQVVLDEAELIQILVDPLFRSRGLAKAALQQWHQNLAIQNVSQVFLEVRKNNQPGLALYHGLGYVSVGARKNYYHYNNTLVDAWVMSLAL